MVVVRLLAACRLSGMLCLAVLLAPAAAEAGCLFPCGIFGLQCRNGGVPPGSVPTSQPVYGAAPVAYAPPPVAYAPPAAAPCVPCRAAPAPACVPCRPAPVCVPCRPAPVCVPCNPCPTVCPPCPTVCPSACPTFDPCAAFDPCRGVVSGGVSVPSGVSTTRYTAGYQPWTAWRRELFSVPQTTYRPVPVYDPAAGGYIYYTQPVTTYARRVQMAPYTTYRRTYPNYYGYRPTYGPTASVGGCTSGSCGVTSTGSCASGNCGVASPTPVISAPSVSAPVVSPSVSSAAAAPAIDEPQIGPAIPAPSLLKPPSTYIPSQPSDRRAVDGSAGQKTTPVTNEPTGDGPRLFDPRDRVTSLPAGGDADWSNRVFRTVVYETVAAETAGPQPKLAPPATTAEDDEFGGWRPVKRP